MAPTHRIRKTVRILLWFANSIGIPVNLDSSSGRICCTDHRTPYRLLIFIVPIAFAFCTVTVYGYLNLNNFNEVVTTAAFVGCCILFNLVIPNLYVNRYVFADILRRMDANFFHYVEEADIPTENASWITADQFHTTKLLLVLCYTVLGFSLVPVSLLVEYLGVRDIAEMRIYPSWYPWSVHTWLGLILTYGVQVVSSSIAFWYYYTLQIISFFFTSELLRQKERLCSALNTVHQRTEASSSDCGYDYDRAYRRRLMECFTHYRQILSTFDLYKPWFTFFFTVELTIDTIIFAFLLYNVMEFPQPLRVLTLIGASLNIILNLFSRCIAGEKFLEMNEDIACTLFHEMNWYAVSKENRTLLKIFHALLKTRSNAITAFSTFPASYYTFAAVTRLSYSYLGFIKATLKA